jgi:hypothetical protein
MPDLADLLNQAIGTVHTRGGVLAPTGRLSQQPGQLVHTPQWAPAPAEHPAYHALRTALSRAAAIGRTLAAAVDVLRRPGLADIRSAHRQASTPTPSPARLAGQWYPQPDGIAETTVPSASVVTRPSGQQQPSRGRAR